MTANTAPWESRDWQATTPDDRLVLLSPAECSLIEAFRDGRNITVFQSAEDHSGKPDVVFGEVQ